MIFIRIYAYSCRHEFLIVAVTRDYFPEELPEIFQDEMYDVYHEANNTSKWTLTNKGRFWYHFTQDVIFGRLLLTGIIYISIIPITSSGVNTEKSDWVKSEVLRVTITSLSFFLRLDIVHSPQNRPNRYCLFHNRYN